MNGLEQAILGAVVKAQTNHLATTGWGLWWGPESFLQYELARAITSKTSHLVYTEASPAKIAQDRGGPGRGRPLSGLRQRFDLVVWRKSTDRLRAVAEVKRAWTFPYVDGDARKLEKFVRLKQAQCAGYLVLYSDVGASARSETLAKRRNKWALALKRRGWAMVGFREPTPATDRSRWCVCLFRLN